MRQEFIDEKEVETKEEAKKCCPWAAEIVAAEGGWMAFESVDDFRTWSNQE